MADTMTRIAMLLVLLFAGTVLAIDPPAEALKVPPRPLEDLRFPPGTVIVVRDSREGLGKIDAVVLSPAEYRKLVDAAEQLKKQASPDKPQPPSKCRITGAIEQRGQNEVVRIRSVFDFVSSAARTTYFLGFRRAAAIAATIDGNRLPRLEDGTDGYSVVVEGAGPHSLTLDLELPLQARGTKAGERGVVLNLPGSPITTIEQFDLPRGVETVRLAVGPMAVRALASRDLRKPSGDWPALALGPLESVELFWDTPAPQRPAAPVLTADAEIRVQLGESLVRTTAGLTLRSLSGRVSEWRLQTPPGAEVSFPGAAIDAGLKATAANEDKSQWIIHAGESGVETVAVEVQVRQERKGQPLPLGPFSILGAVRQLGTIRLIAPNHLRPRISAPRNDVGQREVPVDVIPPAEAKAEFLQAIYSYGQISPAAPTAPLMLLDSEPVRGDLRTQVSHNLQLTDAGWRLTTEIRATPIRTELETLEVEVPAVLHPTLEGAPRELVEKIERADPASNRWQVRLAHPRRTETTIRLEALYPRVMDPDKSSGRRESASLALPRVQQSQDRDGRVAVTVPDGFEIRGTVREWDRDRVADTARPLEEIASRTPAAGLVTSRTPAVLDLSWAPRSAAAPSRALADVTLDDGQASVRQTMTWPASGLAKQVVVRAIGPWTGSLRIEQGGTLTPRGDREWVLIVAPSPDRDATVILDHVHRTGMLQAGGRLELGLIWPDTTPEPEMRVQFWLRTGGLILKGTGGSWEELPAGPLPDRESLPALVLFATGSPPALSVDLGEAASLAPASVVAERVLIHAVAGEARPTRYLARFLLQHGPTPTIDVELPATVATVGNLEVSLGGKRLDQVAVIDANGAPTAPTLGRIIRIPLGGQPDRVELTLSYLMQDWRTATGPLARWRMSLTPPRLRGPVFIGPVRWRVVLPGDDFVLPGNGRALIEQRWGLRRLLPAPLPARSEAELDRWFQGEPGEESRETAEQSSKLLGVVVRPAGLDAIDLIPVPRVLWYLACSLVVLALGGVLAMVRRSRWVLWLALIALLAASAVATLLWPVIALMVLAGAIPGAVVLAILLLIAAWQSRRFSRRVVFMPGFSRTKPSSARNGQAAGSSLRRREPSTVDAPPVT